MPRYYPTIDELLAEDYFPPTIQELMQWLKPEEEKEARVMQILRSWEADKTAVAPPMERQETETPKFEPDDIQEAMALLRIIPKAKPVYPPPPPFKMPRFSKEVLTAPLVREFGKSEGIKALVEGTIEAKKKAEDDFREFVRNITYPESLINEATNRFLSKGKE